MSEISENISAHEWIASDYDKRHGEIFNTIEQNRLHQSLKEAKGAIATAAPFTALDFGCGTGNLTRHLLDLNFFVTCADVTPKFLSMVKKKFGDKIHTSQLNGENLSQFKDNTFDLVATYSVLHHIPDYLKAVKELIRVTKPGGVIYLDHETNSNYWSNDLLLEKLYAENPQPFPWHKLFNPINYINKIRKVFNPRFQPEGDIHVWPDDHIEWDKIEELIQESCNITVYKDYLLYKSWYNEKNFKKYEGKTTDMHVMMGIKS